MSTPNDMQKGNCVKYNAPIAGGKSIGIILASERLNGKLAYTLKVSPGEDQKSIIAYRDQISAIVLNNELLNVLGFNSVKYGNAEIFQYGPINIMRVVIIPDGAVFTELGTYIINGKEVMDFGIFRVFEGPYDIHSKEFKENSTPVVTLNELQNYSNDKYGKDIFSEQLDSLLGKPYLEFIGR